jgi:biotin carboxyl carrier protein
MSIGRGQLHCLVDGYGAFYRDMILLEGVSKDHVGDGRVVAPMHGSLLEVAVAVGDSVSKGQLLAVLEAMKMHYEIVAEVDGEVVEVSAVVGDQVAVDAVLVEIKTVQI